MSVTAWFGRLRTRWAAARAAGPSIRRRSVPGAEPAAAVVREGPSRAVAPGAWPDRGAAWIAGMLEERLAGLRPHVLREANRSDVGALLHTLHDPADDVIRRPPTAAQDVLDLCRRPDSGLGELTTLLERDPGLVQALLRHANSAWYASRGGTPVATVGPAVQRIGTSGVYATVMSAMLEGQMSRPGAEYAAMARMTWEHMVRVAPLARRLAPCFDVDPEEAFTLGLLHDVGKLVFFDRVSDLRRKLRRPVHLPRPFLEDALRALHEPLGGMATLAWGLPQRFTAVVASHHRTDDAGGSAAQVVYLAERLDLARARGETLDPEAVHCDGRLTPSLDLVAAALGAATSPPEPS